MYFGWDVAELDVPRGRFVRSADSVPLSVAVVGYGY